MVDLLSLDVNTVEDRLAAGLEYTVCKDEYLDFLDEAAEAECRLLDVADEATLSSLLSRMNTLREVFSKDKTDNSKGVLNNLDICIESLKTALAEK
jgi:hypothetical protein